MLAPIILILLELLNLLRNIKPGAYLIGWDNLLPEFNLSLNWQRSLFSLWQEYRGLGLLDGMAHSANLIHTLYITLLSLVLPQNLLRFVFIHSTHLLGGIGLYYLLIYLTKNKKSSIFGAIFYMFNLGIIQMYFAPLEVFALHFAALPWLTLTILQAFKNPNKKTLGLLFLTCLLTSPQGFVPTVFIAFLILFFFILLFHVIQTKNYKTAVLVSAIVFLGNAFWITPYMYSALKTPQIIQNTRINQYGSEEIYYRNKAHGTLLDTLEFKGFMLTTIEYDQDKNNEIIFMGAWKDFASTWWYHGLFSLVLLTGAYGVYQIRRRKNQALYPFIASYAVLFIFLANNTPVLEQINTLLRAIFPLLGEAFRFPFTKFITVFIFSFSILFAYGLTVLFENIKKYNTIFILLLSLSLGAMNYPVFTGNFTSPLLRLTIPQEYFDLISYMKTQDPNQRIAMLPTHTFWNWHYRTWGHRGSGFLWYGLAQPTLERAFDPWSLQNEQEYNEMASSLNTQDQEHFNSVIEKYDISYLLLDEYIINTISTQPVNFDRLTKFLDANPLLTREKVFGRLILYKTKNHPDFIYQIHNPAKISTASFTRKDQAFLENGNYTTTSTSPSKIYPFSALFTEKLQKDLRFQTNQNNSHITLSQQPHYSLSPQATITIPSLYNSDYLIPVKIDYNNQIVTLTPLYPQIRVNGQLLSLNAEPFSLQAATKPIEIELNDSNQIISLNNPTVGYLFKDYLNTITLVSKNSRVVTTIDTRTLSKADIIIQLPYENITSLLVSVPKSTGPFSAANIISSHNFEIKKSNPGPHPFGENDLISEVLDLNDELVMIAKNANVQVNFYKDNLPHQQSYLLLADADYKKGLPISWYIDNTLEKRAEVEGLFAKKSGVNTFIIPASQEVFSGYGFHFTLKSVGTEDAQSLLKNISLYPFPQKMLEGIVLTNSSTPPDVRERQMISYEKIHPGLFTAHITNDMPTLVLSQKYDPGWNAYLVTNKPGILTTYFPFLFGKKLTDHILLNNWSNAWTLSSPREEYVVISFIPLYTQYVGLFITFIVTPLSLVLFFLRRSRHKT